VVYEKFMKAARRHSIPVNRVDDPERAVEEVHRYVDVVRGPGKHGPTRIR